VLTFLLFYFLYSYYFVYAIWVQAPTLRGVVNSYILQHSRGPRHRSSILSLSPCSLVYRQVYSPFSWFLLLLHCSIFQPLLSRLSLSTPAPGLCYDNAQRLACIISVSITSGKLSFSVLSPGRLIHSHVPCSAHLKDATVVNAEGSKVSRLVCCLLLWITLTAPIEAPSPHLAVFLSSPAAQLWTSSDSRCRVARIT
jgi:hypothetical protein